MRYTTVFFSVALPKRCVDHKGYSKLGHLTELKRSLKWARGYMEEMLRRCWRDERISLRLLTQLGW